MIDKSIFKLDDRQKGAWVTIGNFDGLHLGHQALIQALIKLAKNDGKPAGLITFWPHPKVALGQVSGPFYLCTRSEKQVLFKQFDLDFVYCFGFDNAFSTLSAEDFLRALHKNLFINGLVTGANFSVGRAREGTLQNLQSIFDELKIHVEIIEPILVDGEMVSSGHIRHLLTMGQVSDAKRMLGRNYSVQGKVIQGKGVGSKFGFPTANIAYQPEKFLPKTGVYATWAYLGGKRHPAVSNVGLRPTFEYVKTPKVETLLLDFEGNIYGELLKVAFVALLRDEVKFDGVQPLLAQIEQDKVLARRILENDQDA